jgi:hypothetical protein
LERAMEVVSLEKHVDITIFGLDGNFRHVGKVMPKIIEMPIETKNSPGTILKFHDHIFNELHELTK